MASAVEEMEVDPASGDQLTGPQLSAEDTEVTLSAPTPSENATPDAGNPAGLVSAPAADEGIAITPMVKDPPRGDMQPAKEHQTATDQPPVSQSLELPLPDVADPALEPLGQGEEPPVPPEPVPLIPLDRAAMVNSVLAGRRPTGVISQPPARLQLPLPREGFMCDQCGERFVLPSSLALHQNRRTMEIAFKCKACDNTRLFDNKCRFLEHLDGHGMDVQSLDPESVDISALSSADLSSPTRVLPALGTRLITGPPRMVKMVNLEPVRRPADISCPMCNTLCTTDTIREHMCPPTGDALEEVPPRCPECAQPCASECSLLAHHGLHKPNLFPYPYVCPECSVKVLGSYDDYRRHVVASCLHLTRDLKICCAVCLIEVGDVKQHMLQTHVTKLYKCRKCPLAFESINGFNSHVKGKHGGETMVGETPYMAILKCPFCAATFNHPKTLRDHLGSKKHGDRTLEQVRFVFRCPECGVDYGRKELLSDHLMQVHPDFQIAFTDKPSVELAPEPLLTVKSSPPTPPPPPPPAPVLAAPAPAPANRGRSPGQPPPLAVDGVPMPMPKIKQEPGRKQLVFHRCVVCQADFRRKATYKEHLRMHIEQGVPVCLLCNMPFDSHELLKNHIAEHASEIGSDRCGLCYAKHGSRDALQLHLENAHDLRDFTCPYCELHFNALSDLLRHNFAKHRGPQQGRPARPKPVPPPPPPGALKPALDEDDDDLPLSQMAGRKAGIRAAGGPLPPVSSILALANEKSAAADGKKRRGVKRPRPGEDDGPPRLSRVVKRTPSPHGAADHQPARRTYRCVCCGLQTDVRADFVAHVALHRQGSQHQCPECGQCYSTKPSLLKHLLLVHRLREPPPEVAASEQQRQTQQWEQLTRDLEPGQCHVCRAQCGDEERLQRHLRMHGRAALKAHQRDQARRQRRARPALASEEDRAETLEAIADFVAGGGPGGGEEDEEGEEVIELEMKDGQVTQKQLRKGVPIVHGESSDEEGEVQGNGEPAPIRVKAVQGAVISANGHPEEAPPAETAAPVSA